MKVLTLKQANKLENNFVALQNKIDKEIKRFIRQTDLQPNEYGEYNDTIYQALNNAIGCLEEAREHIYEY